MKKSHFNLSMFKLVMIWTERKLWKCEAIFHCTEILFMRVLSRRFIFGKLHNIVCADNEPKMKLINLFWKV